MPQTKVVFTNAGQAIRFTFSVWWNSIESDQFWGYKAMLRNSSAIFAPTAFLVYALFPITPAIAGRTVIDVARVTDQNCDTGCLLSLSDNLTGVLGAYISPEGFVRIVDGPPSSDLYFYVASSDVPYQAISGYTLGSGSSFDQRVDFVNFYAPGRSTEPNGSGNRPTPDFQIQFGSEPGNHYEDRDLTVAFAYSDFTILSGAKIGYSGVPIVTSTDMAGAPAERLVYNRDGLLLGQQDTDSSFDFVLSALPDANYSTHFTLTFDGFQPRFASRVSGVPEPSTWAMMFLGFGFVGAGMRTSKKRRPGQHAWRTKRIEVDPA